MRLPGVCRGAFPFAIWRKSPLFNRWRICYDTGEQERWYLPLNLCDYNEIRGLLARHGFRFSKSMGQNFLIDPAVPMRIAEASGADESCGVLEIGPGIGPLTAELAQRAAKVAAVELDKSL